jgi:hypothetical protein
MKIDSASYASKKEFKYAIKGSNISFYLVHQVRGYDE